MGYIYLHKNNKDNCKVYVGQSIRKNPKKRWDNGNGYLNKVKDKSEQGWHYSQPRMAEAVLNSDWEKDWDHRILEDLGNCSSEELNAREEYWIDYFDATNPLYGYNARLKAEGKGSLSEETKKKMSEAKKGHFVSEETRRKISEDHKGKHLSKESIEKRSNTVRGRHHSEETKKKMSEIAKGRKISEEQRKKMSEARKGKPNPHKGYPRSEETRKKMSESHRRRNEK